MGTWSDTCYSNYDAAASYALTLISAADALAQSDCDIDQSVRDLASNLSNSVNSFYNELGGCVDSQVDYNVTLLNFDLVADDYEALVSQGADLVDLNLVADSFNDLVHALK